MRRWTEYAAVLAIATLGGFGLSQLPEVIASPAPKTPRERRCKPVRHDYVTLQPVELADAFNLNKAPWLLAKGTSIADLQDLELSSSPAVTQRWYVDKFYAPAVIGFTDNNLLGPPARQPLIFELLLNSTLVYGATIDEPLLPFPIEGTPEEEELEKVGARRAQFILSADLFSPIPLESIPRLQARIRGVTPEDIATGGVNGNYAPFLALGKFIGPTGGLEDGPPPTLSLTVGGKREFGGGG